MRLSWHELASLYYMLTFHTHTQMFAMRLPTPCPWRLCNGPYFPVFEKRVDGLQRLATPIRRLLHLIRSLRLGKDVKTQKHAEQLYEMCIPQLHPDVLVILCLRKDERPVVKLYRNPVKDYIMYVNVMYMYMQN